MVSNVIVRKVTILLIVLYLIFPITPGVDRIARSFAFHIPRWVAGRYLNYRTKDYKALEGQNFIMKYTAVDEDIAQQALNLSEQYFQEIQQLFAFKLPKGRKALIVIYPDKHSLNSSFGWDMSQNPMGVYWAGSVSILSPHNWATDSGQGALADIFKEENPLSHELTHLMVDYMSKGNYPRWLSEGLAQFTEKKLTNYTLQSPMENSELIAIERIDSQFDNPEMQLVVYRQARVMVEYLVGEYGWDKILQYLELLGEKNSPQVAFRAVYGFSNEYLPRAASL